VQVGACVAGAECGGAASGFAGFDAVDELGARRRRSGGGPGEGCVRMSVGTYLYLHALGAGNPIAVLGLAR
jgi:hypothetical protein